MYFSEFFRSLFPLLFVIIKQLSNLVNETTIWWFSLKLPIDSVYFHFLNILKRKSFSGLFEFAKEKKRKKKKKMKMKKKDQNEKKWKKEIGQQTYAIECMRRYKQIQLHSLQILFINRKINNVTLSFVFLSFNRSISVLQKLWPHAKAHGCIICKTYISILCSVYRFLKCLDMQYAFLIYENENEKQKIFTFHSISYAIPYCIPKLSYWAIE